MIDDIFSTTVYGIIGAVAIAAAASFAYVGPAFDPSTQQASAQTSATTEIVTLPQVMVIGHREVDVASAQ